MQVEAATDPDNPAYGGYVGYSWGFVRIYDLYVLNFTLPRYWRCPKKHLRELYDKHAGERHLDIGVGSGYLIDKCHFPTDSPQITLMDMSPNSLRYAARRIKRYSPRMQRANVLEPWPLPAQSFDSVAMCNLLHCVPGTLREKSVAFDHAQRVLVPGGTLFGATLLGTEANHTKRSRKAMQGFNDRKAFSNLDDRIEDLEAGLAAAFPVSEVEIQGAIGLFSATSK